MLGTVERWMPIAYQAFLDYDLGGVRLSAGALEVIRRMLSGEQVAQADSGLSKREWRELMQVIGRETTD